MYNTRMSGAADPVMDKRGEWFLEMYESMASTRKRWREKDFENLMAMFEDMPFVSIDRWSIFMKPRHRAKVLNMAMKRDVLRRKDGN